MVIFGLVVISVHVIPAMISGEWTATIFILELLVTTLTICTLNYILGKLPIEYPIIMHLIRMCLILIVVYGVGWIWQWYSLSYAWIIVAMVVPVYAVYYLVETLKVGKDVSIINNQIQSRKQRKEAQINEENH